MELILNILAIILLWSYVVHAVGTRRIKSPVPVVLAFVAGLTALLMILPRGDAVAYTTESIHIFSVIGTPLLGSWEGDTMMRAAGYLVFLWAVASYLRSIGMKIKGKYLAWLSVATIVVVLTAIFPFVPMMSYGWPRVILFAGALSIMMRSIEQMEDTIVPVFILFGCFFAYDFIILAEKLPLIDEWLNPHIKIIQHIFPPIILCITAVAMHVSLWWSELCDLAKTHIRYRLPRTWMKSPEPVKPCWDAPTSMGEVSATILQRVPCPHKEAIDKRAAELGVTPESLFVSWGKQVRPKLGRDGYCEIEIPKYINNPG